MPPAARVTAAIALLDRGFGRPTSESADDSCEIRVVIRHIVDRGDEACELKTIEHQDDDN
jgi:hypothetical protein